MQKINVTSLIKLFIVFLAVALLAGFSYGPIVKNIHLGLDLKGGLHVVMEAQEKAGHPITSDTISKTIAILRNRVDKFGVSEPIIQAQGNRRVIVDLPGVKDPEHVASIIGETAELQFRDEKGNVVVTGANLKDAKAQLNSASGEAEVTLEFDSVGAKKFGTFTAANVGKTLGIYLDNELQGAPPTIKTAILDGNAVISGGFTDLKVAEETAVMLRSGSLPVSLKTINKISVGPTLGKDSLDKSVKAGIIGLLMIVIFMIGYYRLPGLVANISLVVYGTLVLGVMALLGSSLTLPGIAAFILSIGMAVDSNIIIFERIKEEIRLGKTLKAAIDAGFSRAFLTIIDSHVTTLIAALVLMYFGTGPIKGFAVTLTIGIFASLFTALTFSQYVLKQTADLFKDSKYYGV